MQVYTFSTGSCRDGIYLDRLVSSKEKVKDLIQGYLGIDDFKVVEVKFLLDKIEVWFYDIVGGYIDYKYYELVTFSVSLSFPAEFLTN